VGFLKKIKNNLTGSWAEVGVEYGTATRGGSLEVTATVVVKAEPISTDGVLVEVRCQEEIDIPSAQIHDTFGSTSHHGTARATSSEAVVATEVRAAGPQELAAGSTTTVTATVPIPADAPPAMRGRHARYEWQVRARVDMKGNDPDSGWQTLQVT
jgi:hypothetical protein